MRLRVLVEGPSEEAFLKQWLPRFLPNHYFQIVSHQGKGKLPQSLNKRADSKRQGLLDQLPAKLRAYGRALTPDTDRVLVIVDADEDNCEELKQRLEASLRLCNPEPIVLFRIAVEETEAYFLGDWAAIKRAFPMAKKAKYETYTQDSICGTWELLRDIIGANGEDKVRWATEIGRYLSTNPKKNRSPSFRQLCMGVNHLVGESTK